MAAEKKIGSLTYRVDTLPAMQTITMGRRIANLFGKAIPSVAPLMEAMTSTEEGARDEAAIAAFGVIAAELDGRFDDLVRELAEMAEVQWNGQWIGVTVEQDELVQDAGSLLLIAFFALETNFRSFFSGPLAKSLARRTSG